MRCDDVRGRLPDRLDDLLDPESQVAVDGHLESCGACREALDRAAAVRDALYRPWGIDDPAPAQASPISSARPRGVRLGLVLLRYAAVFAAGVLVARQFDVPANPEPTPTPAVVSAPLTTPPLADYPRRIR